VALSFQYAIIAMAPGLLCGVLLLLIAAASQQKVLAAKERPQSADVFVANSTTGIGGFSWHYGSRKSLEPTLREIREENDWKNDLVLWFLPDEMRSSLPRLAEVGWGQTIAFLRQPSARSTRQPFKPGSHAQFPLTFKHGSILRPAPSW
jgi:hypothetical protein